MTIKKEWRRVLRKAWSVRLIALAGLLSGAEIAVPMLDGVIHLPRGLFAGLCSVVTCAALVARVAVQKDLIDAPNSTQN